MEPQLDPKPVSDTGFCQATNVPNLSLFASRRTHRPELAPRCAGLGEAGERVHERPQLAATTGEAVLDVGRTSVDHCPLEHPGALEVGEALGQGRRWNRAERLLELVEADGPFV